MENFPSVITADGQTSDAKTSDAGDLQALWQAIGGDVEQQLAATGAVLLRGFGLTDAAAFDALIAATG